MSNNLSNSNTIMAGIKEVGHKVFGGYAELLRIPHTCLLYTSDAADE